MQTLENMKRNAGSYLRQGMSPRRLALTIMLGFVIGCIPVVGLPTAICAVLALAFRLNQPAIQAANYIAMPFQVALIVPLLRLGSKMFPMGASHAADVTALVHSPAGIFAASPQLAWQIGGMAGQALFAWMLLAVPIVVLLTPPLAAILRRVPALAAHHAEDGRGPTNKDKFAGNPDLSLRTPLAVESGD